MRVMVMGKATDSTVNTAGIDPVALGAMSRFNAALINAGVLVALGGLAPSSAGKRITREGDNRTVIDGPFTESMKLAAGFMILEI